MPHFFLRSKTAQRLTRYSKWYMKDKPRIWAYSCWFSTFFITKIQQNKSNELIAIAQNYIVIRCLLFLLIWTFGDTHTRVVIHEKLLFFIWNIDIIYLLWRKMNERIELF